MPERDISTGLIRLHILHHATREPVFGLGMIAELDRHGYRLSPGTLYPTLHSMEEAGFLVSRRVRFNGRIRRIYVATRRGRQALNVAKAGVRELFRELFEDELPGQGSGHRARGASRTLKDPGGIAVHTKRK